jgi:hypothetical protein
MRKARQTRAFLIANSLWGHLFKLFERTFPKVSSRIHENSRFLETGLGDRRIKPLRARRGSTLWSPPHGAWRSALPAVPPSESSDADLAQCHGQILAEFGSKVSFRDFPVILRSDRWSFLPYRKCPKHCKQTAEGKAGHGSGTNI